MKNEDYGLDYAEVYDLITSHKDYLEETKKLLCFLSANGISRNIVSIGCGTGSHESILSKFGYNVLGYDTSPHMIKKAQERESDNLRFTSEINDVQKFHKGNGIGCITSLFNVVNCLLDSEALLSFFRQIFANLDSNGLFIFEAWNRDEVFLNPPVVVSRRFDFPDGYLERVATPYLYSRNSSLRILYKIKGHLNSTETNITSIHDLKLFGVDEIVEYLHLVGFSKVKVFSALPEFAEQTLDNISHGKRILAFVARKQPN